MTDIVPIVLCKNEEVWISRVLSALVAVFPHVIVADTGSTDGTLEQIAKVSNIHLMTYSNLSPAEVGLCRGWMQAEAKAKFGAERVMLVDADELYPIKYLRFIRDNPIPADALSGFTYGIECTELDNSECWMVGDADGNLVGVNRQAVFSVDSKWSGQYPFESPDTHIPGDPRNYYWKSPDPSYHYWHLHGMKRSSKDDEVHFRLRKKHQFSCQDRPDLKPIKLWIQSEKDYQDEL